MYSFSEFGLNPTVRNAFGISVLKYETELLSNGRDRNDRQKWHMGGGLFQTPVFDVQ